MSQKPLGQQLSEASAELCLGFIGFALLFGIMGLLKVYNPFSFLHDIAESTGTGPLPLIVAILIVIVACVVFTYYGRKY